MPLDTTLPGAGTLLFFYFDGQYDYPGGRVGEDDLLLAQVPGHVVGRGQGADVDPAAGAAPTLARGGPGEQQVERGSVAARPPSLIRLV